MPSNDKKLRLAVIGAGSWAQSAHLPTLKELGNIEFVGVCRKGSEALARVKENFGFSIANFFSKTSRSKNGPLDKQFNGIENEWLYNYSKELNTKNNFDFFIYGHRHLPLKIPFDNSVYFNLGEWITYQTFGKFDGENFELLQWKNGKEHPYKTLAENDV